MGGGGGEVPSGALMWRAEVATRELIDLAREGWRAELDFKLGVAFL